MSTDMGMGEFLIKCDGSIEHAYNLVFHQKEDEPSPQIKIPKRTVIQKKEKRLEKRGRKPKRIIFKYEEQKKESFNVFSPTNNDKHIKGIPCSPPRWFHVKKVTQV